MEKWEIELREKLEKELPDGYYECGTSPWIFGTGKGGKINFEVNLRKEHKRWTYTKIDDIEQSRGIQSQIEQSSNTKLYNELTEEDIRRFLTDLQFNSYGY